MIFIVIGLIVIFACNTIAASIQCEAVVFEKSFLSGAVSGISFNSFSAESQCFCAFACLQKNACNGFIFQQNENVTIWQCYLHNSTQILTGNNTGFPYYVKKRIINFINMNSFNLNGSTNIINWKNQTLYFVSLLKDDDDQVLVDEQLTYSDAKTSCINKGMNLVSIKTDAKNTEIMQVWQVATKTVNSWFQIIPTDFVWTSGHYVLSSLGYVWDDGTSISSSSASWNTVALTFAPGMCITFDSLYFNWETYLCSLKFRYVCEKKI